MRSPRFGLGFRTAYADEIAGAAGAPGAVDWLEVVADHYLGVGGPRRALLERLCRDHPIALHGVGLGIAGSDPLDADYLDALGELVARCEPVYVSDHLCWTAFSGWQSHDLLPIAHTAEVLSYVAERVSRVQERIGRALLLENATAYVGFRASEMTEAEFFAELCRTSGCGVLLDVNNLYVNAQNLGTDPARTLAFLPESVVGYLHVAGHAVLPDVRIDTHAEPVPAAVWDLFRAAVQTFPRADVILERDGDLPPYAQLVAELDLARAHHAAALAAPPPQSGPWVRAESAISSEAASEDQSVRSSRSSSSWRSLQRSFWQRVVTVRNEEAEPPLPLAELLDADLPVRAERGMRVYRDGYVASLCDALATNFASLVRVLSGEDWAQLTAAYLAAHPPRGHGFVGLGSALPSFVREHRFTTDYGVSPCVFAEMAQLEQAQIEAQDAADPDHAVAPADLAAVAPEDWERARLAFAPSLQIVRATHDVAPVVRAVGRGEPPERPVAVERIYLVARRGGGVETEALDPADAALLEALLAGRRFGEACSAAGAISGADSAAAAEHAARFLVRASASGWIARLEIR